MRVEDLGDEVEVRMSREEYFLLISLMSEALETGDHRDFQTRVGASMEEVQEILNELPHLPFRG